MYEAKSFICEHSAEYVLVPELKRILRDKFDTVVPIYPWSSREGSNIAKELHKNDTFKMVGLYPRRPKLISASSPEIIVKINAHILRGAQTGLERGIPIIAGCPLARNFWELGKNPNCVWVELNQDSTMDWELFLDPHQPLKYFNQMSKSIFTSEKGLLAYINEHAKPKDINSAISSFQEIKGTGFGASYGFLRFMGSYKPVYFLLNCK